MSLALYRVAVDIGCALDAAGIVALAAYLLVPLAVRRRRTRCRPADPYAAATVLADRLRADRLRTDRLRTDSRGADRLRAGSIGTERLWTDGLAAHGTTVGRARVPVAGRVSTPWS
jgi:hypothetical protein